MRGWDVSCTTGRRRLLREKRLFRDSDVRIYLSIFSGFLHRQGRPRQFIYCVDGGGGLVRRLGLAGRSHSEEERECSPFQNRRGQNDCRNSDLVNICLFPERCGFGGTIKKRVLRLGKCATTGRKVSTHQIVKI